MRAQLFVSGTRWDISGARASLGGDASHLACPEGCGIAAWCDELEAVGQCPHGLVLGAAVVHGRANRGNWLAVNHERRNQYADLSFFSPQVVLAPSSDSVVEFALVDVFPKN